MAKPMYRQFVRTERTDRCMFCGNPLHQSKLNYALYDTFQRQETPMTGKMLFCCQCAVPFMTEKAEKLLIKENPGLHPVIIKGYSKTYADKHKGEAPYPIEIMPSGSLFYIEGKDDVHGCGPADTHALDVIVHDGKGHSSTERVVFCRSCGRYLINGRTQSSFPGKYPDYYYIGAGAEPGSILPPGRILYRYAEKRHSVTTCPVCAGKLERMKKSLVKKGAKGRSVMCSVCTSCKSVFTSAHPEKYPAYRFDDRYEKEAQAAEQAVALKTGDFITRTQVFSCTAGGHDIEDVYAYVDVLTSDGSRRNVRLKAGFCKTCCRLYILESEYARVLTVGVPVCNVVTVEYWASHPNGTWKGSSDSESVIHAHGYNVNVNTGLSEKQRFAVLKNMIDENVVSGFEICAHLDTLILRGTGNERYVNAVEKWKKDRAAVAQYAVGSREVEVKQITRRVKKIRP